jgi:hypothetical protein
LHIDTAFCDELQAVDFVLEAANLAFPHHPSATENTYLFSI